MSFARIGGKPAIALEVSKRTGENVIDTIARVRQVVANASASWPAGVQVGFTQDRSSDIRSMLSDLQNNVLSAILLVMIVIVWAHGLAHGRPGRRRHPGLLPGRHPGALGAFGLTMNIVVLFSLILAVGMLVDGAIVVTEFADRKMIEGAQPPRRLFLAAATRMAWPITSSTLTTLAAFLPLLFWPGIVGEFMQLPADHPDRDA